MPTWEELFEEPILRSRNNNYVLRMQDVSWRRGDTIWVSADGTAHRIKNMTDRHLENTIKMLKRKEYPRFDIVATRYINTMEIELLERGMLHYKVYTANVTKKVLKNL